MTAILLTACLWAFYCILHSLLAADRVREWLAALAPPLRRHYRLYYNLLACLLLPLPLTALRAAAGPLLWSWNGAMEPLQHLALLAALALFALGARAYDMREFLGLAADTSPDDKKTRPTFGGLHRFVRHPWYLAGIIVLWSRDMDPARLASAIVLTVYIVCGLTLEERRLVVRHGALYRRYQRQVPALIPRPWKFLGKDQARSMEEQGTEESRRR